MDLSGYNVSVRFRDGSGEEGFRPAFSISGDVLSFAPREDAPPSARVHVANIELCVFTAPPTTRSVSVFPDLGPVLEVQLPSGQKLRGRAKDVTGPAGTWMRPEGTNDILVFVPESTAAQIDVVGGRPEQTPPPPPAIGGSWTTAETLRGSGPPPPFRREASETATVAEVDAIDLSSLMDKGD